MKKATKILLITALALLLVGGAAFTLLLAGCGWDLAALSGGELETHEYEITDRFDDIKILADTADIRFLPSEDGTCRVVTRDDRGITHAASVEDGCLTVRHRDERPWYEHITLFGLWDNEVTVYLPAGEYASLTVETSTSDVAIPRDFTFGSLSLTLSTGDITASASVTGEARFTASTGDITLAGLSAGTLTLAVSTGDITLTDVACDGRLTVNVTTGDIRMSSVRMGSLTTKGSTGDIRMTDTVAEGTLSLERSTGDITLDGCDAAEVFIRTTTGDVSGRFLTDKVFLVETSSGDREVPRGIIGGRCEIITSSGDIYFREP